MTTNRLFDIFALLRQRERVEPHAPSFCDVAQEITRLDGAGIILTFDSELATGFCHSNYVARELLDLEVSLGEGPGVDANFFGMATAVEDLLSPEIARWTAYAPRAVACGARAVFSFPVRIGAIRFGALSLFRASPGPLSDVQSSDGYLMASVIGRGILALQAGAPAGELAGEIERQSALSFSVHQAAGMLAVQGSMSIRDALVSLRAHAFASGAYLSVLAESVVARRTRYVLESATWEEGLVWPSE